MPAAVDRMKRVGGRARSDAVLNEESCGRHGVAGGTALRWGDREQLRGHGCIHICDNIKLCRRRFCRETLGEAAPAGFPRYRVA